MIRRLKRRVLRRAERRLEAYGWRRGHMGTRQTGYCLVGAIRVESRWPHLFVLRPLIYRDLADCAQLRDSYLFRLELTLWNDEWSRTRGDVLRVLRCARGEAEPE